MALNRETILKAATLVRPAIATAEYIPAFTHLRFDGETLMACNDITSISVKLVTELEACVPGELFIKALGSFKADTVAIQQGKDDQLLISSGRSKLKVPTLPLKDFPMEPFVTDHKTGIDLEAAVIKGIERCLLSVGSDPTHASQMGVTLDFDGAGNAVLFSTDNFTVSRYQTKTRISLPGESPVILPTFFCQQLVSLSKAFPEHPPELFVLADGLVAKFGTQAEVTTKILSDLESLDFPKIVARNVDIKKLKGMASNLPDAWDAAFNRAMLVMSGELDKATKVSASDGILKLVTKSAMGDADDQMEAESMEDTPAFYVDPSLVLRVSKYCALVHFAEGALVMADESTNFIHLIAHCAKK